LLHLQTKGSHSEQTNTSVQPVKLAAVFFTPGFTFRDNPSNEELRRINMHVVLFCCGGGWVALLSSPSWRLIVMIDLMLCCKLYYMPRYNKVMVLSLLLM